MLNIEHLHQPTATYLPTEQSGTRKRVRECHAALPDLRVTAASRCHLCFCRQSACLIHPTDAHFNVYATRTPQFIRTLFELAVWYESIWIPNTLRSSHYLESCARLTR